MKVNKQRLLLLIAKSGLNESQFIKKAKIGSATLWRIKKGIHNTNIKTIGSMAKALDVDVIDLVEGEWCRVKSTRHSSTRD